MFYPLPRKGVAVAALLLLSACSAVTSVSSVQPDTSITIKNGTGTSNPRTEKLSATSFGNYEFKVEQADGKSLYGVLPLKFNGGYLAVDILFFAPAAFFNLREVYPYYQFDIDKGVVRYKSKATGPWLEYAPIAAESERAKAYFSGHH